MEILNYKQSNLPLLQRCDRIKTLLKHPTSAAGAATVAKTVTRGVEVLDQINFMFKLFITIYRII